MSSNLKKKEKKRRILKLEENIMRFFGFHVIGVLDALIGLGELSICGTLVVRHFQYP
jgi:hypothetical protein